MDEQETQTQTQPQQKQLMSDIFGDSDDEDVNHGQQAKKNAPAIKFDDSDDDIFADSDDEKATGSKGGLTKKLSGKPTISALSEGNLLDSDDEDAIAQAKRNAGRKKRPKGPSASERKLERINKRKATFGEGGSSGKRSKGGKDRNRGDDGGESGDSYDSGEEVRETKEDRDFIDRDDDEHADLIREYEEDNQDFDDEAPDKEYGSKKKSKKSSASSGGGAHLSSGINLKDQDPLSQTLAAMKNPKAKALSDPEKEILVEKLQRQMAKAVQLDNECYAQQQPAVYKMQLLSTVVTTVSMKPLHHTMLERDILSNLRDWIEPRDANTLPALSVRTAVYELLMQLPCLPDHLKRSNGEKPPIGVVIVSLRKHKMETQANKRLLKELMDKWSRPIFAKSTDVRVGAAVVGGASLLSASEHPEVQAAIMQRYTAQLSRSSTAATSNSEGDEGGNISSSSSIGASRSASAGASTSRNVGFSSLMKQQSNSNSQAGDADGSEGGEEDAAPGAKKAPDLYSRARTPYNTGFLFTVQPELKNIDKRNVMEKSLGEGRMRLFKKMSEGSQLGGRGSGLGKKSNPR